MLRQAVSLAVLFIFANAAHRESRGLSSKFELLGDEESRIADSYIIKFHDDAESLSHFHELKANWTNYFTAPAQPFDSEHIPMKLMFAQLTEEELVTASHLPGVEYIHHDMVVRHTQTNTQTGNIPVGIDRIDQAGRTLDGRYTYRNTGSLTDIYIIDTVVDVNHGDWAPGQAILDADCTGRGACLTTGLGIDTSTHGTHVAGTAASPTYGVAKGARIYSVRALGEDGSGSGQGIINAIDHVIRNVAARGRRAVINMSLGITSVSRTVNNAAASAVDANIVVVVAAGNSNEDASGHSPASEPSVITVAASNPNDQRASFSNFGSICDIYAPGQGITSLRSNTDSGTLTISGTSMASPHVAGAAAQLLSADPSRTVTEVADILISTAISGVISDVAGAPNRLLNVQDERFGMTDNEVDGELPTPEETETPADVPTVIESIETPDSDYSLSIVDEFGDAFEAGVRSSGVMFDLQVAADGVEDGEALFLEAITVFSLDDPIEDGIATVYFVADRSSFTDVATDSGSWSRVSNSVGQSQVRVTSTGQTMELDIGGDERTLYETIVVLPEPHLLATGATQGVYVHFSSEGDVLLSDNRELDAGVDAEPLVYDDLLSLMPGRAVGPLYSATRFRSGVAPLVEFSYSMASATEDMPIGGQSPTEDDSRLNDQLECLASALNLGDGPVNMQNGVMFDLSVNELSAADRAVILQSFSAYLVDPMSGGVAEVYTTVNGASYAGQELDSSLWVLLATADDLDMDLNNGETENGLEDDNEMVDIEQPAVPSLIDFDFGLNYELRADGTPQGFYLTFRNFQMAYGADEVPETTTIALNEFVTLTGGKGVSYPFDRAWDMRQFLGEACFSEVSSSAAFSMSTVLATIVSSTLLAASCIF